MITSILSFGVVFKNLMRGYRRGEELVFKGRDYIIAVKDV